jgi:hypothetical protein
MVVVISNQETPLNPQPCSDCDQLAEPPLTTYRTRPGGREFVLCRGCVESIDSEAEILAEVEEEERVGNICSACGDKFDAPGGTTIWDFTKTTLMRVCEKCRNAIVSQRGF